MLRIFTNLLESLDPARRATSSGPEFQHTLELATAVLLIEVVRADGHVADAEQDAVLQALRTRFVLSDDELTALVELAREKSDHTHDLFTFTERLNHSLDERQRIQIFELLWTTAYADGHADAHEAHLLRRLGDLLHLRHADVIGARLRAEAGQR
jgi:uncharacterized tellurite resistance protein B-like protein